MQPVLFSVQEGSRIPPAERISSALAEKTASKANANIYARILLAEGNSEELGGEYAKSRRGSEAGKLPLVGSLLSKVSGFGSQGL